MSKADLVKLISKNNIAEDLSKEELSDISRKVHAGFDEDLKSMNEWLSNVDEIMTLASLSREPKNTPLPNSSNVKFPLITKACYSWSSHTYPEIVKDGKVVKGRIIGKDLAPPTDPKSKSAQVDRVCEFMNWQLIYQNTDWEQELDRMLTLLALIGFLCKKTYYDPTTGSNKSELIDYKDLIIGADVRSLTDARRITHVLHLHKNDLMEQVRAELYLEDAVTEMLAARGDNDLDVCFDILEQHRWLDLDDDGYEEPYIVSTERETGKVLRIVARFIEDDIKENTKKKIQCIYPLQFFTDYHFLTSPKGKFQSVGFGILLLHLNESVNTILNQLIDSGQLANMQGGFIDARIKLQSGSTQHEAGQWIRTKTISGAALKDGILPLMYKEPSNVLFQLLNMLSDAAKDLSSTTAAMSGTQNVQNAKSTAVLAQIQQGMKVFTSIQRRVYRSLTSEYQKLFKLNKIYLPEEEYVNILDNEIAVKNSDFDDKTVNIIPVADPNMSSDVQRSVKMQALLAILEYPEVNRTEVIKRFIQSLDVPNPESLMNPPEQKTPPNPEIIKLQMEGEHKAQQLNIAGRQEDRADKQFQMDATKTQAEIVKIKADAMASLAKAESTKANDSFKEYELQLESLKTNIDTMIKNKSLDMQHATTAVEHMQRKRELDQADQELEQSQQEIDNNAESNTSGMDGSSGNSGAV